MVSDAGRTESIILATASYDYSIRLWQAHKATYLRHFQHPEFQVNALCITPDRQLLAAAGFQHIRMYDILSTVQGSGPVLNYEGIQKNVTAVGFHQDGKWMYSGGEDNSARIWDTRSRNLQCQRTYNSHNPVTSAVLSPNQQELIIADQAGTIHLWDVRTNQSFQLTPEPDSMVHHVDIDPTGTLLAAVTYKGNCYLYNVREGFSVSPIDTGADPQQLSTSPPRGANGGGGSSQPSKATEGLSTLELRGKREVHEKYALKCRFSSDSKLLCTTSADQTAKVWTVPDLTLVHTLAPEVNKQRWVWDCAFSSDSKFVFTASSDNLARLWSVETGQVLQEYSGHKNALTALAFCDTLHT